MATYGNGQPMPGSKSVVDRGTTVKGSVASSSTVLVLGVLEGEVLGPAVEVETGGVLVGKAKVGELRSRGELAGEFEADDVELTGKVRDQTVIRAKALLVAPASGGDAEAIFGECQIDVGDPPSKEQAVSQALAAARAPIGAAAPDPTPTVVADAARVASASPAPADANPAAEAGGETTTTTERTADGEVSISGSARRKRAPHDRPAEGA